MKIKKFIVKLLKVVYYSLLGIVYDIMNISMLSIPFYMAWNNISPVFNLPTIEIINAISILVFLKILKLK